MLDWLRQFALPSVASIVVTYIVLRVALRRALDEEHLARKVPRPKLELRRQADRMGHRGDRRRAGRASALDVPLGLPTFLCGVITAAAVLVLARQSPLPL